MLSEAKHLDAKFPHAKKMLRLRSDTALLMIS
jgi:hypothetical protein